MIGKYYSEVLGDGVDDAASNNSCPTGVPWIWSTFGQCVEDPTEYAAFIIGFVSFVLWFFPCLPQIYQNYKRGNCDEALSIYFLMFWFFGDSMNLTGCILSKQLPIQIYIGVYYIFQDFLILGQYSYYKFKNRWRARLINELGPPALSCFMLLAMVDTFYGINNAPAALQASQVDGFRTRKLLSKPFFDDTMGEIGYILGTVSAMSYLCGRLPQLYKNYKRKSTEGVSLLMFAIIITANITYGLSVLLAGEGLDYFLRHLPWLLGSFGCCICDTGVVIQHFTYKNNSIADDRRLIIDDKDEPDTSPN